jgi:hypothetical protein
MGFLNYPIREMGFEVNLKRTSWAEKFDIHAL